MLGRNVYELVVRQYCLLLLDLQRIVHLHVLSSHLVARRDSKWTQYEVKEYLEIFVRLNVTFNLCVVFNQR